MYATATGSAHRRRHQPCEDAAVAMTADPWTAIAVADGHGSSRHPRAARGAELAAHAATRALVELPVGERDEVALELQQVSERLHRRWREHVLADVGNVPLTADERRLVGGDGPEHAWLAHGTTVLAAAASTRWLAIVQVGDGDILLGSSHAPGASRPVRQAPHDDPRITDSLCHHDAPRRTRTALVDLLDSAADVVLLSTDGFGAAFEQPEWHDETVRQLVAVAQELDDGALADALRQWCETPAGVGGDDVALGLLVARDDELPTAPTTRGEDR